MPSAPRILNAKLPLTVGSLGTVDAVTHAKTDHLIQECDLAEIRLDILEKQKPVRDRSTWAHLEGIPLLFTARRREEGGALELPADRRMELLRLCLEDAALLDIEVASIPEMTALIEEVNLQGLPWVASFHDFEKLPNPAELSRAASAAKAAGAAVFKAAAWLSHPDDVAALARFQLAGDHGIPVASMGMGPLAPVSRLLCAQCGSLLNYGYVGESPTAPGQWDSAFLKTALSRLTPFIR